MFIWLFVGRGWYFDMVYVVKDLKIKVVINVVLFFFICFVFVDIMFGFWLYVVI